VPRIRHYASPSVVTVIPRVSVLLVAHRTRELIDVCLESLYAGITKDVEVVVVDNGSNDGTAERIASRWPQVRLYVSEENLGFGRAMNLAAAHAQGEVLILLNPDTVVHDDAIMRLAVFAQSHPQAGLVGGRTLAPDGTLDPRSCWGAPTTWSTVCFATGLSTAFKGSRLFDPEALGGWARDSVREVGVVTGCLLAVRRDVWDELGGFDPAFFMYGEDLDLSLRATALGYRPMVTPDAVVTHVVGASTALRGDRMLLVMKGKVTIARKHGPGVGVHLLAMGVAVRAFVARIFGRDCVVWPELWQRRHEWLPGY
jgi:N-acetylglucosaminyl-diphospho-decaprenol L-rhamnosyltransferase